MCWSLLIVLITGVLFIVPQLGSSSRATHKKVGEGDKLSAFECGFSAFNKNYLGFCVQFLNIAILFLLVDLEIALLLPLFSQTILLEDLFLKTLSVIFAVAFFLVGLLFLEWALGGVKWKEEV